MFLNSDFINKVKMANNIVTIASKYITLIKKGNNYWARCPFHNEKTPSFNIVESEQYFHCFGCNVSGDVVKLICEFEKLNYNEGIVRLAELSNIPIPISNTNIYEAEKKQKERKILLNILNDTAEFYYRNIFDQECKVYIDYLYKRNISIEHIKTFKIGASKNSRDLIKYLLLKKYELKYIVESGVVSRDANNNIIDSLAGRLIFPLSNQYNNVVAFSGRYVNINNQQNVNYAKYKNTRNTAVFHKSYLLYNINNLNNIKHTIQSEGVIIVEGYMDCIKLIINGINNVVATMGTALTKENTQILLRYTNKLYLCFDGDEAGKQATSLTIDMLKNENININIISIPENLDPDDYVTKYGIDAFKDLINNSLNYIDYKLKIIKEKFDISNINNKNKYIQNVLYYIQNINSNIDKENILKILTNETGVSLNTLYKELTRLQTNTTNTNKQILYEDNNKILMSLRTIIVFLFSNYNNFDKKILYNIHYNNDIYNTLKKYAIDQLNNNLPICFSNIYNVPINDNVIKKLVDAKTIVDNMSDECKKQYLYNSINLLKIEQINYQILELEHKYNNTNDNTILIQINKLLSDKHNIKNKWSEYND